MGAAGITSRCFSALSQRQRLSVVTPSRSSPHRRSHYRQGRRLCPPTSSSDPLSSPLLLRRFESASTSSACRKTSSRKLRNSMLLPLTPDVDLPAARATLFPETRTPLDSTNLPTRAAGYPLSLFSRPPTDGPPAFPPAAPPPASSGRRTAMATQTPTDHSLHLRLRYNVVSARSPPRLPPRPPLSPLPPSGCERPTRHAREMGRGGASERTRGGGTAESGPAFYDASPARRPRPRARHPRSAPARRRRCACTRRGLSEP